MHLKMLSAICQFAVATVSKHTQFTNDLIDLHCYHFYKLINHTNAGIQKYLLKILKPIYSYCYYFKTLGYMSLSSYTNIVLPQTRNRKVFSVLAPWGSNQAINNDIDYVLYVNHIDHERQTVLVLHKEGFFFNYICHPKLEKCQKMQIYFFSWNPAWQWLMTGYTQYPLRIITYFPLSIQFTVARLHHQKRP